MRNTSVNAHLIFLTGVAAELGVRSNCRYHVTGKVNFGDNFNVARLCISYNFAKVFLAVPHTTTVFCIVVERLSVANIAERRRANGAHFCEFGVFGNLNAPALVVGQVPVEAVHLVECHNV